MGTLQADSHSGRIEAGDRVLARAAQHDTRPLKKRLTEFTRVHVALVKAQRTVQTAEDKHAALLDVLAEHDVDQDAGVDALAVALIAEGQPRLQPFKGLGVASPSEVRREPFVAEARTILKLATRLSKRKLTPATKSALKKVTDSAKRVIAADERASAAETAVRDAREKRDALILPWSRAFVTLKRAARVADDDGAKGLYPALFHAAAAKPRKAKPAPAPGV